MFYFISITVLIFIYWDSCILKKIDELNYKNIFKLSRASLILNSIFLFCLVLITIFSYEEKLNFVYCGNIPSGGKGNNTVCPSCKNDVIMRSGYYTKVGSMKDGKCSKCNTDLMIRH